MSYLTTPGRMALALGGGALTGAALLSIYLAVSSPVSPAPSSDGALWAIPLVIFIYAVIWLIGLVAVGLPVWLLLHSLKLRHWLCAVLTGAVLTFAVVYLIAIETGLFYGVAGFTEYDGIDPATLPAGQLAGRKQQTALYASSVLGAIGAAVGLAVWRIAYRPAPVNR